MLISCTLSTFPSSFTTISAAAWQIPRACPLLLAAFWPVVQRHHVAHNSSCKVSVVGLGIVVVVVVKKKICTNKDNWNSTKMCMKFESMLSRSRKSWVPVPLVSFWFLKGSAGVCSGFPFVIWCNLQSSSQTETQQKTVSWPLTIDPSWCTGGCWFTVASSFR